MENHSKITSSIVWQTSAVLYWPIDKTQVKNYSLFLCNQNFIS